MEKRQRGIKREWINEQHPLWTGTQQCPLIPVILTVTVTGGHTNLPYLTGPITIMPEHLLIANELTRGLSAINLSQRRAAEQRSAEQRHIFLS